MAMTIKTDGLDRLGQILAQLENEAGNVAAGALYEGAGIAANAFTAATNSIRTEPFWYAPEGKTRLASPEEKEALAGKVGIAKFDKNGAEVTTIIGISGKAGYEMVNGKKKPVLLIARSINSGTSFMKKQPVYRKAKLTCEKAAQDAIVQKAEQMIEDITKG